MNHRRALIKNALTCAVSSVILEPTVDDARAQPNSTGNWVDETWKDATRSRDVPVRLRLPALSSERGKPWPVLLYSHGLGGSRSGGDVWANAWQEAGFAVLNIQHPGSDTEVLRQGMASLRNAASGQQLQERVTDVRFALDELARRQAQGTSPWAAARLSSIGLAGHSFGAQTVQAIAGQRYPAPTQFTDPRLHAFIALSPNPGRNTLSASEQFSQVTSPFMAVTGSLDGDPLGHGTDGIRRASVHDALPVGQRALLWLDGADHMTFAGNASQRIDGRGAFAREEVAQRREAQHHAFVAQATTLWWLAHLSTTDDARALALASLRRLPVQDSADRLIF